MTAEQEFGRLFGLDLDKARVPGLQPVFLLDFNTGRKDGGRFAVELVQVGGSGVFQVTDPIKTRIYVSARDIGFGRWAFGWTWGKKVPPLGLVGPEDLRPIEELLVRHIFRKDL